MENRIGSYVIRDPSKVLHVRIGASSYNHRKLILIGPRVADPLAEMATCQTWIRVVGCCKLMPAEDKSQGNASCRTSF